MKKLAISIVVALLGTSYVVAEDRISLEASEQLAINASINTKHATNVGLSLADNAQPKVVKQSINREKAEARKRTQFVYEPELGSGEYTYIIELREPSVLEKPELRNLMRSHFNRSHLQQNNDDKRSQTSRNNTRSKSMSYKNDLNLKRHLSFLKSYQTSFLSDVSKSLGRDARSSVVTQYEYIVNGMALRMTQDEATRLADHPKVAKISRETTYYVNTDRGPTLIGAPQIWQGRIPSLNLAQGEGIVVGIIDSGINTDHPSFAEVSGDGYTHTNPLGSGVYLGDCAGRFAELCNNKLIGVYSYNTITSVYSDTDIFPPNLPQNGEDYDGHGSHVAAIAAGNVLPNLRETLPTQGESESEGTPTGFSFEQISGVAPRANIISYQVCFPGESDQDDTYAGCPGSVINQGIEDAIQDGVDVINFSISGGGDPWRDSTERAFLTAQNIGIFVATSAGNDGSGVSSSDKHSPWYTSVAASQHGRENALVKEIGNFTGGATTLDPISGQSNTGALTADIVYAGDFINPNDPDNDPAQCLQPFPNNTFNGQIVVCDRGEIARVEKAVNVSAGGAGGFVLANVQGGDTFFDFDIYVIPGIHINADDGDRLKAWLASGSNHRARITNSQATQTIVPEDVDVLAGFSSRGPNMTISTLTPSITAPGVQIYSAYADRRFGQDGSDFTQAGNFNYLSGTSMSSPHVAGAAALLKSLYPTWTPDNIRSALSLTATSGVRREDGETAADFFDMGAGRIRVDLAAQAGLIMDESNADYLAAEPRFGGEPRSLNLPSIVDNNCAIQCTWTRSFTATQDGTWDISSRSITDGLNITTTPSTFTIQAGQTQEVDITINTLNSDQSRFVFGQVVLSANNSPELTLPVSVFSSLEDIPEEISINATRDADSFLIKDIQAIDIENFVLTPSRVVKPVTVTSSVSEDSNPVDVLDDTSDGVVITEIDVPENTLRLIAELESASAPDLDIYVFFDQNNDGVPSSFEEVAQGTSANASEEIDIQFPEAGRYFLLVQSFSGSGNQPDNYELRYVIVDAVSDAQAESTLQIDAPSSISSDTTFDMRFNYSLADAQVGEEYFAVVQMGRSADNPDSLGLIAVNIERDSDDVQITGAGARVSPGDSVSLGLTIAGNDTNEARVYDISIANVDGASFTNIGSGNMGNGNIDSSGLNFVVSKDAGDTSDTVLPFDVQIQQTGEAGPISLFVSSELSNRSADTFYQAPPFEGIQVEGAPTVDFDGNDTVVLNTFENRVLVIPINVIDPNNDAIAFTYTQTEGPSTEVTQNNGVSSILAPRVDETTVLTFDVLVDDGNGNTTTATFSVNVLNNEAPIIESIAAPSSATAGQQVNVTVRASDQEDDPLVITIDGIEGASALLTTPSVGSSVTYEISVSDGSNTLQDSVVITLNPPPVVDEGGGGGSSSLLFLVLAGIFAGLRKARNKSYGRLAHKGAVSPARSSLA